MVESSHSSQLRFDDPDDFDGPAPLPAAGGRRIRQPCQWVVQTFPSRRGPVLHFSSLPSPRPSIRQHWWILCRCGRCFNAAWNCLVFQTTPSVRLSRHLYLFLNVTQTTRDQPLRLDLQQEPSLQRGSSILRRVLSVLLSDGPRLRELQGPLCWTWVRQRFLTECPGWTSRLSRTPWRPRHG